MKKWNTPAVEELALNETANGAAPSDFFDGEWVEIDGKWYKPGNGDEISNVQ